MPIPVFYAPMETKKTKRILIVLWKVLSRIGFTVFLLALAFLAQSNSFILAAIVFLVFAIGVGAMTVRSFTTELDRLRYIGNA